MPELRRFWLYLLPPLVYAAGIFFASAQPNVRLPEFSQSDKYLHLLAYAGLGLLIARAARAFHPTRPHALLLGALLGSLYGVSDELHQRFVPNRSSDLFDVAADSAGALLGSCAYLLVTKARP